MANRIVSTLAWIAWPFVATSRAVAGIIMTMVTALFLGIMFSIVVAKMAYCKDQPLISPSEEDF